MTVKATSYGLFVDWNNDDDYDDAGEDLSGVLIEASVGCGFNDAIARMASVGRATFVLNNTTKALSPPLEATVLPRRKVKFQMTYGGSTVVLFQGLTDSIAPSPGIYGDRRVVLECVDDMARLDEFEGPIAIQTNVRADAIITAVVAAVYTPTGTDYDAGINLFPFAADRWSGEANSGMTTMGMGMGGALRQTVRASDKILAACTADWGLFFFAKDGTPTYRNRHSISLDSSAELTLDNTLTTMSYRKSTGPVYNYIEVTCCPRTVGETYEVLGRMTQGTAPMIEASSASVFTLDFRDPTNNAVQMGGKSPITPAATTDYTCTSDEAGEGNDETANVTPTMTAYGDRADVTLTNDVARPVYVQSLQVRGYAVRTFEPVTVRASDDTSITAYGKRKLPIDGALMSSTVQAHALAAHLLAYYKDPQDEVRGLMFFANNSDTLMQAARDLKLCDRVVVSEDQTGLSSYAGYITSMTHHIHDGTIHSVTLDLATAYSIGGDPLTWDSSVWGGTDVWVY